MLCSNGPVPMQAPAASCVQRSKSSPIWWLDNARNLSPTKQSVNLRNVESRTSFAGLVVLHKYILEARFTNLVFDKAGSCSWSSNLCSHLPKKYHS